MDDVALARSLDPLDRGVEHEGAAAQRVVLERLHVTDSNRGEREHRRLHGSRREEHDPARPREEPVGDLEAEFRLPMTTTGLPRGSRRGSPVAM